jgi:hypothetical protein
MKRLTMAEWHEWRLGGIGGSDASGRHGRVAVGYSARRLGAEDAAQIWAEADAGDEARDRARGRRSRRVRAHDRYRNAAAA